MKRPNFSASRSLVLAALMVGAAIAQAQQTAPVPPAPPPAQVEVQAALANLQRAIDTGDAALAEKVLAPTVQIYEQGHKESSRQEYLAHHFKEDAAFAKAVPSKTLAQSVTVEGNLAVVMAETHTEGTWKDKPVRSAGLSTYVLRRDAEGWRVVHIHWSSRKR